MEEDLNLINLRYNTALTVFFVPYALLEVPSNVSSRQAFVPSCSHQVTLDRAEDAATIDLDLNPVLCLGSGHGESPSGRERIV